MGRSPTGPRWPRACASRRASAWMLVGTSAELVEAQDELLDGLGLPALDWSASSR